MEVGEQPQVLFLRLHKVFKLSFTHSLTFSSVYTIDQDHIYPSSPLLLSQVTLEHAPLSTSNPPSCNPLHSFSAVC